MDLWSQQQDRDLKAVKEAVATPATALGSPATGGSLTLSGVLTAATVVTGDPDVSHGIVTLRYGARLAQIVSGAPAYTGGNSVNTGWIAVVANDTLRFDFGGFKDGDRLIEISVYAKGSVALHWTATSYELDLGNGGTATLATFNSVNNDPRQKRIVYSSAGLTIGPDIALSLEWVATGGTGQALFGAELKLDRP